MREMRESVGIFVGWMGRERNILAFCEEAQLWAMIPCIECKKIQQNQSLIYGL